MRNRFSKNFSLKNEKKEKIRTWLVFDLTSQVEEEESIRIDIVGYITTQDPAEDTVDASLLILVDVWQDLFFNSH